MSWSTWAAGVLSGIAAPEDKTNIDTLWAWSNAESGSDVMRWNNPLNTTQPWPNSKDMNSVGVKAYATENDGMAATVTTLLNGYYPVILANFRASIPRQQWQNACPNLGTWGTGCGWLNSYYGAAPGTIGGDMTDDDLRWAHDVSQQVAFGTIDTSAQSYNDYLFAIHSGGQTPQGILAGWMASAAGQAWQQHLHSATAGAPGPAGPPGPEGPPGPALSHHHTGGTSGPAVPDA